VKEEEEKKFGSKFCEFRNIAADISFHRASAASWSARHFCASVERTVCQTKR
jgi:hypothetical protein